MKRGKVSNWEIYHRKSAIIFTLFPPKCLTLCCPIVPLYISWTVCGHYLSNRCKNVHYSCSAMSATMKIISVSFACQNNHCRLFDDKFFYSDKLLAINYNIFSRTTTNINNRGNCCFWSILLLSLMLITAIDSNVHCRCSSFYISREFQLIFFIAYKSVVGPVGCR